ncbi:MAG: S24/S26 family peptidase [Chitinispirillaceae bacterium]|nr:S24/S26 family peptidase [Chitinispirillaceae bacterium]
MRPDHKAALLATLATSGFCEVTLEGRSMWPFIRSGDRVTITRQNTLPRVGSVVAVFCGERLVIHRLIKRGHSPDGTEEVWIRGDSSPDSSAQVPATWIIGRVTSLKHNGRVRAFWITTPFSLLALPLGAILCILVRIKMLFRPQAVL